jgi:hypothetical protein
LRIQYKYTTIIRLAKFSLNIFFIFFEEDGWENKLVGVGLIYGEKWVFLYHLFFIKIVPMTDVLLYQTVIQKLGKLPPDNLSEINAFLTTLINRNPAKKTKKKEISPIHWLEQLAKIGGVSSIDDPVEWQRNMRQDKKLPFR